MDELYAEEGKIKCKNYFEVYIPKAYFLGGIAVNLGASIETFGVVFARETVNGTDKKIKMFNAPTFINFMVYEMEDGTITINGEKMEVLILKYLPKSYVMHQTVPNGREIGEAYINMVLGGKIPTCIKYDELINLWWKNLEIAGVNYKVPSKIYEMILAAMYRNKNNKKERYGEYYGKSITATGYDYATDNVRSIVKNLSTFSGIVYEDIGSMVTHGIINSETGVEEDISPLEKIIHY